MADHSGMTLADRYRQAVAGRLREQHPADVRAAQKSSAVTLGQFIGDIHAQMTLMRNDTRMWVQRGVEAVTDVGKGIRRYVTELTEFNARIGDTIRRHAHSVQPLLRLMQALQPGEFLGDFVRVRGFEHEPEDERAEAAFRLIERRFRKGDVFFEARWHAGLEEAFRRRMRERDLSRRETWKDLVIAPLFDVIADLPIRERAVIPLPALTLDETYNKIRCFLRQEVERQLLLGHTTDSHMQEILGDEEEPPIPHDILESAQLDLLEWAELRADLAPHLGEPASTIRLLIQHDGLGVDLATLARPLGITPGALATRLSRAREDLRKLLM